MVGEGAALIAIHDSNGRWPGGRKITAQFARFTREDARGPFWQVKNQKMKREQEKNQILREDYSNRPKELVPRHSPPLHHTWADSVNPRAVVAETLTQKAV